MSEDKRKEAGTKGEGEEAAKEKRAEEEYTGEADDKEQKVRTEALGGQGAINREKETGLGQESRKKRVCYKRSDCCLAGLLLVGGWFYVRGDSYARGLGLPVFILIFLAAGCYYLTGKRRKMDWEEKLLFFFTAASALWFFLGFLPGNREWARQEIGIYVGLFAHCAGVYWILSLGGNRIRGCLDESGAVDLVRGFFVLPFCNFGRLFGLIFELIRRLKTGEESEKQRRRQAALQIFYGIICSIPVLILVLPMLMKADESFKAFAGVFGQWVAQLSDAFFGLFNIIEILLNLLILMVSCYLFGLFYGAFYTKPPKEGKKIVLSPLLLFTFSGIICGVYLLFFVVKAVDAAGVFSGTGERVVYSSFARQGFFELCLIAVLNLFLYYLIQYFSRSGSRTASSFLTMLSIETLFFVGLAFSKMCLYISVYGFTFKRVFTSWFMCVLFAAFSLLLGNVWKQFNAIRIAVFFAASTFLLLAFSNLDAWILRANVIMGLL